MIFGENEDNFLHSLKIFDNQFYFVAHTEQDGDYPSLYKMKLDGSNMQKVIENVVEDYIVLKHFIYYTSIADPTNGDSCAMYKYDLKNKICSLIYKDRSKFLSYADQKLYFVSFSNNNTLSGGTLKVLDIKTNNVTVLDQQLPLILGPMHLFDQRLYFKAQNKSGVTALICYDLKDKTQSEVVNTAQLNVYDLPLCQLDFDRFLILDQNLIYFNLICLENNIKTNQTVVFKDGKVQKPNQELNIAVTSSAV